MGESSGEVYGAPRAEPDAQFEDPAVEPLHRTEPDATVGDEVPDEGTSSRAAIAGLSTAVCGLEQQARAFHVRAENYEQIIRQMQSRIEQLQGDQIQALLKPVIQRLAVLHAQAMEAAEQARERGEPAEKDFDFFTVAIEEALGLVDIESVAATPSTEFDPARHHASRVVATVDPSLDRRIQRVLRQGFTYTGAARVFLPAQVCIYRYEPPPQVSPDSASQDHDPAKPGEGAPGE